ncbi:MAG: STAS domain-containing protein [Cellvibrionaceae bacterium]
MATKKATVKCGEALTISNVADLHTKLTSALESSSNIELDVHEVEKVDTAGLQLLVALHNELEKSDGNLTWKAPSEAFTEAVAVTGMTPYLTLK